MKEQAYFYQVYKGLAMGFGIQEAAFMAYMADLDRRRMSGSNVVFGLNVHLGILGMGRRTFERCVRKTVRMGLLKKIPIDGKYDYVWNGKSYARLVEIVSTTPHYALLRKFCDHTFETDGRNVSSVTDSEISELRQAVYPQAE